MQSMKYKLTILLSGLLLLLASNNHCVAQKAKDEERLTRMLFIFDASNSMNGVWEKKQKITVARGLLNQAMDSLDNAENVQLALRVYGHQKDYTTGQDCDDTKLLVPFGPKRGKQIKTELNRLRPKGTTPIAATLEKAANDFPRCPTKECRNVIVLITDGIEECNGDPCAVSLALQRKGIILKPFVIGIGLDVEFRESFECIGTVYNASNEKSFGTALNAVISQALNTTTAQVNLLDESDAPTETNVNMAFYDQFSGELLYDFVHTMNSRGRPDTLILNPVNKYRIVAQTIPPRSVDSAEITPGKHTIIGISCPQGELEFKMLGAGPETERLNTIVREKDKHQTLNVQSFTEKTKYITGVYDLEILTLPRTYINDVEIKQSHTTTIEIPQPGVATFSKQTYGYGSVYVVQKNELILVATLDEKKERQTLVLQPGEYVAVFRPKAARQSVFTIKQDFRVISGASVAVRLN